MKTEKFSAYQTTEDFILDKEFTHWVLHPNKELDAFWGSFAQKNPEKGALIRDAALIIKSLQPVVQSIPQQKLDTIFQRVLKSERKIEFLWGAGLKYAASIVILIGLGSLIYLAVQTKNQFPIAGDGNTLEKGKLILANGTTQEFSTENTTIKQTNSGKLTINTDTISVDLDQASSILNQIIIPNGKRSDIILADGTHIWLNSGSQLSYPTKFKSSSREVYLLGEALFEVKANPDQPFYVITKDVKIKVLGTIFNVSSYAEDNTVQTVLLKGKVTAGKNRLFAATMELNPGERLTYDKSNEQLTRDKVDVQLYVSWINGYLVFKDTPITEVYMKLERYYNQDISVESGLEKITFSGKLDLKDNLKEVLENIAFASSVNLQENNGKYVIKK
jgi:hypothetical protein